MLLSKVKVKYPNVYNAINAIAGDNGGRVNLNATLPTNVVVRVSKGLAPIVGKTLKNVLGKRFSLSLPAGFKGYYPNDGAITAFTVGDSLVINAVVKVIPDGVYLNAFFISVFNGLGVYRGVIVYG